MPIPKDYPLESFDPRFKDILLRGAKERIEIPCASAGEAYRLQVLLCVYRSRAKKHFGETRREEWVPFYQCVVGLKDEGKDDRGRRKRSSTVVIYPRHSEFEAALSKIVAVPASTTAPSLPVDPLEALASEGEANAKD